MQTSEQNPKTHLDEPAPGADGRVAAARNRDIARVRKGIQIAERDPGLKATAVQNLGFK